MVKRRRDPFGGIRNSCLVSCGQTWSLGRTWRGFLVFIVAVYLTRILTASRGSNTCDVECERQVLQPCPKPTTLMVLLRKGDPPGCWQRVVEKLDVAVIVVFGNSAVRVPRGVAAPPCVQHVHDATGLQSSNRVRGIDLNLMVVRRALQENPFQSKFFVVESGCNDLELGAREVFAENVKELHRAHAEKVVLLQLRELTVGESIVNRENRSRVDFSKRRPALAEYAIAGTLYAFSRAAQRQRIVAAATGRGRSLRPEQMCLGAPDLCMTLDCRDTSCSLLHDISMKGDVVKALKPVLYYKFPAPHYFVHIPKTGSSFLNVLLAHSCSHVPRLGTYREPGDLASRQLRQWYADSCRKEIYLCGGHCGVAANHWESYKGHFVGMFRDPKSRVVSGFLDEYHDCKRLRIRGQEYTVENISKLAVPLEEKFASYAACVGGCAVKQLNNIECGLDTYRNVTDSEIQYAVDKVLNYFGFVGLTPRFKESVHVWKRLFGTDLHGYDGSKNTRPNRRPRRKIALEKKAQSLNIADPDIHVWNAALKVWMRQLRDLNGTGIRLSEPRSSVLKGSIDMGNSLGHLSQDSYSCEVPFWSC